MSAQQENSKSLSVPERLRRYQTSQGLPWKRVAERLGISLSMVMMVLRGDRNLSAKAIFRLEEIENEAAERRSAAEHLAEQVLGGGGSASEVLGKRKGRGKGSLEVAVDYIQGRSKGRLPVSVVLIAPREEMCRRLTKLFAETLDTRVVALACLPEKLRNEVFLDRLTADSRARLTTAALELVIPDWRKIAAGSS